jgi:hypothetical protein
MLRNVPNSYDMIRKKLMRSCSPKNRTPWESLDTHHKSARNLLVKESTDSISEALSLLSGLYFAGIFEIASSRAG